VVSQDLDELFELSERIGAICAGRLSAIYPTREVSVERIGLLMAGTGDGDDGAVDAAVTPAVF